MKKLILLLIAVFPLLTNGQDCKPDYSKVDKITKTQNVVWKFDEFYHVTLGDAFVDPEKIFLNLSIGRYGSVNAISLTIVKEEDSKNKATFESAYHAVKGNQFVLGTKGGTPLVFTADEVNNESKVSDVFGLVTTVTLSSYIKTEDLEKIKSVLTTSPIDAVRVALSGGVNIQKNIREKKGNKMLEKFVCFFDFNDKNKIAVPEEPNWNNLPPNPNVPENLPIDTTTNKITFTDVVLTNGVSKEQLYERAKAWMINYYKSDQFSINDKEAGRLTKEGMFTKTYNGREGKTSTTNHFYNITIYIKEGKYKYVISDLTGDDGKTKMTLESVYKTIVNYPKLTKYVNQQIYEGVDEVIKSLKTAMASNLKKTNDW
ncbi:MAG: hypothetical protein RJA07_1694 [Bacteroidota bacterium]|jgi:ribosomal protein L21E